MAAYFVVDLDITDAVASAPGVPGAASVRVQHVMSRLTGGRDAATTRGARSCWLCSERLHGSVARVLQKAAHGREALLAEVPALVAASMGRRSGR